VVTLFFHLRDVTITGRSRTATAVVCQMDHQVYQKDLPARPRYSMVRVGQCLSDVSRFLL
jgi:hypothetical protein